MICSSVIEFLLILRSCPLGGGGRWMGVGWVCEGVSHACMHAHTHVCMLTHYTCMLNMINMDASMLAAICNFYTCIHVCACMCVYSHACAYVWRHPHASRHPPTYLPPPQSCREPKRPKFNKSWTNQDISILFKDSLPLNTPEPIYTIVGHPNTPTHLPHPQSWGNHNQKNCNNS